MRKITIALLLSLCLLFSFQAYGQIEAESAGGSAAVTETATTYTITKTNIVLAGAVTVTSISFTTAVATTSITVGDDVLNKDGSVIWIDADGGTGNATISSDQLTFSDFSGGVDIDGDFTAGTIISDAGVSGTTITGTGLISTTVTSKQFELFYDATNTFNITLLDDAHTTFTTVDPDGAEADINFAPDGNVGIKTVAPSVALQVTGAVRASTGFSVGIDPNAGRQITLYDGASGAVLVQLINSTTGTTGSDGFLFGIQADESAVFAQKEANHIEFWTSNDETVRYHASGGVSIGDDVVTTDPGVDNLLLESNFIQGIYVIRKHVAISGAADDAVAAFFTITTTDETGSADGGSYSVKVHLMAGEGVAASGATNVSSMSGIYAFSRVMQSAGTGANSVVAEVLENAGADAGSGAIVSIDVTVAETSEFVQQVSLQVDTSGGTFNGFALVEVVYSVFTTPPVIG